MMFKKTIFLIFLCASFKASVAMESDSDGEEWNVASAGFYSFNLSAKDECSKELLMKAKVSDNAEELYKQGRGLEEGSNGHLQCYSLASICYNRAAAQGHEEAMKRVKRLPSLSYENWSYFPIGRAHPDYKGETIQFNRKNISDKDLHEFCKANYVCPETKYLQLRENGGITDDGIDYLKSIIKKLPHLKSLELQGTGISEAGFKALQAAIIASKSHQTSLVIAGNEDDYEVPSSAKWFGFF